MEELFVIISQEKAEGKEEGVVMEDHYFTSSEEEESEEEMEDYRISKERQVEILSKFKPIELSCRSPGSIYDLWVFWSDEEEGTSFVLAIQNQIKTFLCSLARDEYDEDVLIQFWAPTVITTMMGGLRRRLLTTSQQPFAFSCMHKDEDVIRYRNHCVGYTFGDGEGVIGRVFHNQFPEFRPNLSYNSLEDHSHQDLALSCGLTQIWAFPVFQPSQQSLSCDGVLEFLFHKNTMFSITFYDRLCRDLELAGLLPIYTQKILKQIQEGINHAAEADEIKHALQLVCVAQDLSNACALVRCTDRTSNPNSRYDDSNVSGRGDFVVFVPDSFAHGDYTTLKHCDTLESRIMRVGQGLIGNAFLSHKPFLCTDLTQLSIGHYPMAHIARLLECTGCITICLQNIATGSRDYVIEFYLSQDVAHSKDLNNLLSSVLMTLKRCLKSFEAVVGDPGGELFVEIDKFSIDSVFESLKTCPTIIKEIEPGALHNEGEVLQANFPGQHSAMEQFAKSEGIGGDSVGLKQRGKGIPPKNNCLEKKSTADNQKESSCSYETLEQHFGRKLEDAAESLGVSRSTVKRWCRENNISRWPSQKRSKVTSLPPIPKQINEPIHGNVEPVSDSSGKHPSSSSAPTGTVTVKVTYRNDIIKFQLPFSSRRIDLMENVTLRLKLSEGTFAIKYLDNEGDYILIACDVDLQDCINSFRTLDLTAIKMFIEPLQ